MEKIIQNETGFCRHKLLDCLKQQEKLTVQTIHITEDIEGKAWELFKQYSDKGFSFTDCTSFIVMRQLNLTEAFTNDHHFEQMGLTVLLK